MPTDISRYPALRLKNDSRDELTEWLSERLKPMVPKISLPAAARVRIHRFRVARGKLVAFERNIDYHMSEELKQAGGNEALEQPVELEAKLRQRRHVYDLRRLAYLGLTDRIRFTLDPWRPSLFALTEEQLPVDGLLGALEE